ncbi:MAG TPA: dihydrofolate reductase family protein [Streptosporangiaceae bacterium]|nr:dihydrofolate reductase family protein [Streptosporangiaceae bacterium]
MGKMLYSATMSLDGFIAGPGGDMSWLTEHLGPNPTVDEVIGKIGALPVGNRTFRGDDPHKGAAKEGKPFGGGWTGPQFVLAHHAPDTPVPGITFVGDLGSGVAAAKAAATSTSSAPALLGSASRRACATRSSCASRPSCSATAAVRIPGPDQRQARTRQPDPRATSDEPLAACRPMSSSCLSDTGVLRSGRLTEHEAGEI